MKPQGQRPGTGAPQGSKLPLPMALRRPHQALHCLGNEVSASPRPGQSHGAGVEQLQAGRQVRGTLPPERAGATQAGMAVEKRRCPQRCQGTGRSKGQQLGGSLHPRGGRGDALDGPRGGGMCCYLLPETWRRVVLTPKGPLPWTGTNSRSAGRKRQGSRAEPGKDPDLTGFKPATTDASLETLSAEELLPALSFLSTQFLKQTCKIPSQT